MEFLWVINSWIYNFTLTFSRNFLDLDWDLSNVEDGWDLRSFIFSNVYIGIDEMKKKLQNIRFRLFILSESHSHLSENWRDTHLLKEHGLSNCCAFIEKHLIYHGLEHGLNHGLYRSLEVVVSKHPRLFVAGKPSPRLYVCLSVCLSVCLL